MEERQFPDPDIYYMTLLAGGVNRFLAIERIRALDPVFAAQLWMKELGLIQIPKSPRQPAQESTQPFWDQKLSIRHDIAMGATLITQGAWTALLGSNPSTCQGNYEFPVDRVSWRMICEEGGFLDRLNAATAPALPRGWEFRLPTEIEWVYALLAGRHIFHGISCPPLASIPEPVGTGEANPWGFFEMNKGHWEWCMDCNCKFHPVLFTRSSFDTSKASHPNLNQDRQTIIGGHRVPSAGVPPVIRRNYEICTDEENFGFRIVCSQRFSQAHKSRPPRPSRQRHD